MSVRITFFFSLRLSIYLSVSLSLSKSMLILFNRTIYIYVFLCFDFAGNFDSGVVRVCENRMVDIKEMDVLKERKPYPCVHACVRACVRACRI